MIRTPYRSPWALVGALVILALAAGGCARPWQEARGTIASLEAAVDAVEPYLGDLPPGHAGEAAQALELTRQSLALGQTSCDLWEALEAPEARPRGWLEWVALALEGLGRIVGIIKAAGVPIPSEILAGISAAQLLLPALLAG